MERIATFECEWTPTKYERRHSEGIGCKILEEILGILKDTLVMSTVVMAGTALTMLLW